MHAMAAALDQVLEAARLADHPTGADILLWEPDKQDFRIARPIPVVMRVDVAIRRLSVVPRGHRMAFVEMQAAGPCPAVIDEEKGGAMRATLAPV